MGNITSLLDQILCSYIKIACFNFKYHITSKNCAKQIFSWRWEGVIVPIGKRLPGNKNNSLATEYQEETKQENIGYWRLDISTYDKQVFYIVPLDVRTTAILMWLEEALPVITRLLTAIKPQLQNHFVKS